jgi:molybdopterin/thiamine biosynthesis adenylyltransferase/nitroreductase
MSLCERLARMTAPPGPDAWRAELFDLAAPGDRDRLTGLLDAGRVTDVRDGIAEQLADLLRARAPGRKLSEAELRERVERETAGRLLAEYGRWAYYPWSGRLVHVLPEPAFRELRSDRNRYKITPDEQTRLRACTVGVAGLSVGLSVVLTMALEGVGGRYRLADFDALGLSNLNRLRAGVHDLGVNKAVVAARLLAELDPYLEVEAFTGGVTEDNLVAFLVGGGPLDLLMEECDDLYMKVRLREEAARLKIPVVMETSDRGLLDVERFDREPGRKPFHGLIGDVTAAGLRGLASRDKIPFVLQIVDGGSISPTMAASLVEVGETISTWPQLGSAVTLGGAVATDAARRILLGTFTRSGRFYVDLGQLVGDGLERMPEPPAADEAPLGAGPLPLPSAPAPATGPVTREEVRHVVAHGTLAPSGGNSQPWRFEWSGGELGCRIHRGPSFLDYGHRAACLAVGAAVENMTLAASALGLEPSVQPGDGQKDRDLVCSLRLTRMQRPAAPPELFVQVTRRLTNRRQGNGRVLQGEHQAVLETAAAARGARLQLITDPGERATAGAVLGQGDRFRTLTPPAHAEMLGELRWSNREARRTRDGIDLATLELAAADRAALGVIARPDVAAELRRIGGGQALARPARAAAAAAAAVGLLTFADASAGGFFAAGRAMQHVWLTATALGIAFRPWTPLLYLFGRLEHGGEGLSAPEREELARLQDAFRATFHVRQGEAEVMVFLLAYAPEATARSQRRPVEEVLTIR